jgi:4'-phosphopantetheinyl transferase
MPRSRRAFDAYPTAPRVICRVLSESPGDLAAWTAELSAEERDRAARFRFDHDREGFIWRRATLRRVLADVLGCGVQEIEYVAGRSGKPALGGRLSDCAWRFNLSHSHGLMLVAVARNREIGVDVEKIEPLAGVEELAEQCLTRSELERFRSDAAEQTSERFLHLWTRKEALLKAIGVGLSVEPQSIEVGWGKEAKPDVLQDPQGGRWTLDSFRPRPDYWAAVAVAHSTPPGLAAP